MNGMLFIYQWYLSLCRKRQSRFKKSVYINVVFVEFQINNLLPQQRSLTYQYMFYKSTKRFSIVIVMAVNNLSQKCETAEYYI